MSGRRLAAALAVTAGVAALAVKVIAPRHRSLRAVPAALRTPMLYLPLQVTHRRVAEFRRRQGRESQPPVGVSCRQVLVPGGAGHRGVPAFLYQPDVAPVESTGAMLWIHGGGLVLGSAARDHVTAGAYAKALGVPVLNVDYRLAPEHPYPAAIDDCFNALRWLHENAAELGVHPARIAVAGASAGGGLAAAVAQRAADSISGEHPAPVCFQGLIYPMLDDRTVLTDAATVAEQERAGRGVFVWNRASNRFGWSSYLGHRPRERDERPYIAPARREDLSGLAPAWIGVGSLDLFHDEDVAYAARLREAGVDCQLQVVAGMYHGADGLFPQADAMKQFAGGFLDALHAALG